MDEYLAHKSYFQVRDTVLDARPALVVVVVMANLLPTREKQKTHAQSWGESLITRFHPDYRPGRYLFEPVTRPIVRLTLRGFQV